MRVEKAMTTSASESCKARKALLDSLDQSARVQLKLQDKVACKTYSVVLCCDFVG